MAATTWFVMALITTTATPWRMLWNYAWEYRRRQEMADIKLEMMQLRKDLEAREFIFVVEEAEAAGAAGLAEAMTLVQETAAIIPVNK